MIGEHLDDEATFCIVRLILQGDLASVYGRILSPRIQYAALEDGQKRLEEVNTVSERNSAEITDLVVDAASKAAIGVSRSRNEFVVGEELGGVQCKGCIGRFGRVESSERELNKERLSLRSYLKNKA